MLLSTPYTDISGMLPNLVSLHQWRIEIWRQFGVKQKGIIYCFARQGRSHRANVLKTVSHPGEASEESYSVQRAKHSQLIDILLIGWLCGK